MTVFISCSGSLSKEVGELLYSWLPEVIQGAKTWLYSEDIEKGSRWPDEVNKALATTVGLLCVTQENKKAPWLLFEAGGLSKGLSEARVCPLLIDLEPQDVNPPLSHFIFTLPNKDDMRKLVETINRADPEKGLSDTRLQKAFERLWPEFEKPFQEIRDRHAKTAKTSKRSTEDLIVEILEICRALQRNSERRESALGRFGSGGHSWADLLKWYPLSQPESENLGLKLYSEVLEKAKEQAAKEEKAKEKPPEKSS